METSTELNEIKASSAPAILGANEKIKSLSFPRLNTDSAFEPVGVVSARIVEMLIATQQKYAA